MSLLASWMACFSLSSDIIENLPELLMLELSIPDRFLWSVDGFSFSIIIGQGLENLRAKFSGTAGTFLLNWSWVCKVFPSFLYSWAVDANGAPDKDGLLGPITLTWCWKLSYLFSAYNYSYEDNCNYRQIICYFCFSKGIPGTMWATENQS